MNITIAEECLILISNAPKCFGFGGWGTPLGKLTTLPRPPNSEGIRAFGAWHSLFHSILLRTCYAMGIFETLSRKP